MFWCSPLWPDKASIDAIAGSRNRLLQLKIADALILSALPSALEGANGVRFTRDMSRSGNQGRWSGRLLANRRILVSSIARNLSLPTASCGRCRLESTADTQPGDYDYYCTEQGSPGRHGMAGRVRVAGDAPAFVPGKLATGTWYNPALDGQGFTFEWLAATNEIAYGWFTFADTGDTPAWFYGVAQVSGAVARAPLTRVRGGRFVLPTAIKLVTVGELVLTFHACDRVTASWRRDDLNQHGSSSYSDSHPPMQNANQRIRRRTKPVSTAF